MKTGCYKYGFVDLTQPRRANGKPCMSRHWVRVEIVEITDKWATVRFLGRHMDGRGVGTVTRVRSRNVVPDEQSINHRAADWLPYKDD